MKKYVKASATKSPTNIVDGIILKLEDMIKYAQDINEAIQSNNGEVYDVEELEYDADNIIDELTSTYAAMGKMAQWQKLW